MIRMRHHGSEIIVPKLIRQITNQGCIGAKNKDSNHGSMLQEGEIIWITNWISNP